MPPEMHSDQFKCGGCGVVLVDPHGTLREGDLTYCDETRDDAGIRVAPDEEER